MTEVNKMKKCCVLNVLFGLFVGFFLNMFIMFPQYRKAAGEAMHDHKYCQKCTCEKKCGCPHNVEKCTTKCLCD